MVCCKVIEPVTLNKYNILYMAGEVPLKLCVKICPAEYYVFFFTYSRIKHTDICIILLYVPLHLGSVSRTQIKTTSELKSMFNKEYLLKLLFKPGQGLVLGLGNRI